MVTTTNTNVYIFTNDGTGGFELDQTIAMNLYGAIICTDINNDSLPYIIGGTQTGNGVQISVLTQRHSGTFLVHWNGPIIGYAHDSIHDLEVVVFNNDGLLDFLSKEIYGGQVEIYLNTGSAFSKSFTKIFPSRVFGLESADMNHDDNIDIIVSWGFSGTIEILSNDGTGSFFGNLWHDTNFSSSVLHIHANDLNNDGNKDLYLGGYNGVMKVLLGDTNSTLTPSWDHLLDEGSGFVGYLADVYLGGCIDIFAGEFGIVRIFENDLDDIEHNKNNSCAF